VYTAVLFFSSNILAFWIEQGERRQIRRKHWIFFVVIAVYILYCTTSFVESAWEMNDDLTAG
jgi:hypothetical protein